LSIKNGGFSIRRKERTEEVRAKKSVNSGKKGVLFGRETRKNGRRGGKRVLFNTALEAMKALNEIRETRMRHDKIIGLGGVGFQTLVSPF